MDGQKQHAHDEYFNYRQYNISIQISDLINQPISYVFASAINIYRILIEIIKRPAANEWHQSERNGGKDDYGYYYFIDKLKTCL